MHNRPLLRQVIHREVKTHYTISEILECGHRYESLALMGDPLVAKRRACRQCTQALQVLCGGKKPAQSELFRPSEWKAA